MMSQMRR